MAESVEKIRLGISACLLGQEVRFNGGHKRDPFLTGPLAELVEYVPVCPEVAIGLGVPRPPIRLVGDPLRPRALGVDDPDLDVTDRLEDFALARAGDLGDIQGFVLKKDSPSCGMERVKVYSPRGGPGVRQGAGLFARVLMQAHPLLPVEEEGRLNDPVLRENFINRAYVLRRWQTLQGEGLTPARLLAFHAAHKYLVMAHSQAAYQRLGRLLSDLSGTALDRVGDLYLHGLMDALKRRVNRRRHVNVLQHILGYLKRRIDGDDKAEILATIEAYRRGEVPLVVPITLFRHYFRRHPDPYMGQQVYLRPHPEHLGLRNAL